MTVGTPIRATDQTRGIPKRALKTPAGAAMIAPQDIALEIKKRNAVSDRVFESKRCSRYS